MISFRSAGFLDRIAAATFVAVVILFAFFGPDRTEPFLNMYVVSEIGDGRGAWGESPPDILSLADLRTIGWKPASAWIYYYFMVSLLGFGLIAVYFPCNDVSIAVKIYASFLPGSLAIGGINRVLSILFPHAWAPTLSFLVLTLLVIYLAYSIRRPNESKRIPWLLVAGKAIGFLLLISLLVAVTLVWDIQVRGRFLVSTYLIYLIEFLGPDLQEIVADSHLPIITQHYNKLLFNYPLLYGPLRGLSPVLVFWVLGAFAKISGACISYWLMRRLRVAQHLAVVATGFLFLGTNSITPWFYDQMFDAGFPILFIDKIERITGVILPCFLLVWLMTGETGRKTMDATTVMGPVLLGVGLAATSVHIWAYTNLILVGCLLCRGFRVGDWEPRALACEYTPAHWRVVVPLVALGIAGMWGSSILTPEFGARHFAEDNVVGEKGLTALSVYRTLALAMGVCLLFCAYIARRAPRFPSVFLAWVKKNQTGIIAAILLSPLAAYGWFRDVDPLNGVPLFIASLAGITLFVSCFWTSHLRLVIKSIPGIVSQDCRARMIAILLLSMNLAAFTLGNMLTWQTVRLAEALRIVKVGERNVLAPHLSSVTGTKDVTGPGGRTSKFLDLMYSGEAKSLDFIPFTFVGVSDPHPRNTTTLHSVSATQLFRQYGLMLLMAFWVWLTCREKQEWNGRDGGDQAIGSYRALLVSSVICFMSSMFLMDFTSNGAYGHAWALSRLVEVPYYSIVFLFFICVGKFGSQWSRRFVVCFSLIWSIVPLVATNAVHQWWTNLYHLMEVLQN